MALDDRDWYREEPSKAWSRRWETSSHPSSSDPGGATTRGPIPIYRGALPAIVVSFVFAALALYVSQPWEQIGGSATATAERAGSPTRPATQTVRLGNRPELDAPVTAITHWWVTSESYGRVDVYVPIGSTPRKALTIELASRGYQVVG